jgi:hypothetical protein
MVEGRQLVSTVEFPWRDKPYPFDDANPPVENDRPLWTSGWVFMAALLVWALMSGTTIIVPVAVLAFSSLMSALDSRRPRWFCVVHSVVFGACISSFVPLYLAAAFLWEK